jgi:hypothetical protein
MQGIAADASGTLFVVGMGAGGLELHRRAADGTWSAPEVTGLTPSVSDWSGLGVLSVAAGPGGELVAESEGDEVVYRSGTGEWSLDDVGSRRGAFTKALFDTDGTAHIVRHDTTLVHLHRSSGGSWQTEPLAGFPKTEAAAIGKIDGVLSVCCLSFPNLLCGSKNGPGDWSTPAAVAADVEARGVDYGGGPWVIGNLEQHDGVFFSTRTLVQPATPAWQTVSVDVSPTPDGSAFFFQVQAGAGGAVHLVQQVTHPKDTTAYVRYVRLGQDGSVNAENVACDAYRPGIAVLPGDRPVVVFDAQDEASGALAHFLAWGPAS